ncbi:MAG: thiamine phosphate synthase, partial [Thermoguttaceae bacterium]|nr:thiamine phosphate synthase [Thermoguttaceae bacterium]
PRAAILDVNGLFVKGELQEKISPKIAADFICLTAQNVSDAQLVDAIQKLLPRIRKSNKFLFVVDRCDIAVLAQADGVVLSPGAVSVRQARELLPACCAVGVRVENKSDVQQAFLDGADWILTPKRFPKCSIVQATIKQ